MVACSVVVASGAPAASPTPARVAIQELLDRRAQAVLDHDRAAFMSTLDRSSSYFVRQQSRLWQGLESIDLDSYSLTADWARYGDLAHADLLEHYPGAARVSIPLTEERYRLAGFDPAPAAEDMYYTFVLRDGVWKIGSDYDLNELGFESARHLWDYGALDVTKQGSLLVMRARCHPWVPGKCVAPPGDLTAIVDAAKARVESYWHEPWSGRVILLLPASQPQLGRLLQATFNLDNFVAFAYSTIDLDHNFRLTGKRVLLNPPAMKDRSSSQVLTIVSHELTHVATRGLAGPFVPAFVDEGIAEYVGYNGDPASLEFLNSEVAAGAFDGLLPLDYQFTTGSGTDIFRSYQKSESAVRYFIDRWGLSAFERFYRVLGRARTAPGTIRYHVSAALQQVVGMSYDGFQHAWASSIGT